MFNKVFFSVFLFCLMPFSIIFAKGSQDQQTTPSAVSSIPENSISVRSIPALSESFIRGADVSMLAQIEEAGGIFYNQEGEEGDGLEILQQNGINWIRLRLWNNPVYSQNVMEDNQLVHLAGDDLGGGNNDLEKTIAMARRAKDLGLKFLLDFHYSDFWADPSKQTKPTAWANLDLDALSNEIYAYTYEVVEALIKEGAAPDMVQIGNEVNGGMLWPEGKTWREGVEVIGGMDGFIRLLKQASLAVRDADPNGRNTNAIKIAIHLADGGDNNLYRRVFDSLSNGGVDFDIIGLSYYPYWHGSMEDLASNMEDISVRYQKDLVIMETAYAYTFENGDDHGNLFQPGMDLLSGYKASIQGQATFIRNLMAQVAEREGLGIFYWEPDWIPVPGTGWKAGEGNAWENQALFDFQGRALPSLSVFNRVYSDLPVEESQIVSADSLSITAVVGESFSLPSRVVATFDDDSLRAVPVDWDNYDFSQSQNGDRGMVEGRLGTTAITIQAEITFTDTKNLVTDSSFEFDGLEDWTLDDPAEACLVEKNLGNAHTGSMSYKYWLDSPFTSLLSRTFRDIPNGNYVLSCWAAGGGGDNSLQLLAWDFGSEENLVINIVNTGWQKWKKYVIPLIEVTNNQCTIGISIDAQSGNWGNFDDVEFFMEEL